MAVFLGKYRQKRNCTHFSVLILENVKTWGGGGKAEKGLTAEKMGNVKKEKWQENRGKRKKRKKENKNDGYMLIKMPILRKRSIFSGERCFVPRK